VFASSTRSAVRRSASRRAAVASDIAVTVSPHIDVDRRQATREVVEAVGEMCAHLITLDVYPAVVSSSVRSGASGPLRLFSASVRAIPFLCPPVTGRNGLKPTAVMGAVGEVPVVKQSAAGADHNAIQSVIGHKPSSS